MKNKFPFGIDDVLIVDSLQDFLQINNLTSETLDLINATDFIQKTKRENPNQPDEFLRDRLIGYFSDLSSKYPDVVFFDLKKAMINFQFGDKESGIKFLEQAYKKHPNHHLTKILLAFEYVQIPKTRKTYEVLGVIENQEINSIKDIFPNIKKIIKSDYLQFLFILIALNNIKAGEYHVLGIENKKEECIKRIYELVSTMIFIDEKHSVTIQVQDFLNKNKNYN